jgi:coenzyme F420-reducing hydrogenase gamma subunit
MVAQGIPCLGPVTHAGCGSICPAYDRGCYGCYGPAKLPNVASLAGQIRHMGLAAEAIQRLLHTFNAWAPEFREGGRVALELVSR